MNIWFTSDTHFGHANIIKYCNRPFKDLDEMNDKIIKNWNSRVKEGDTVFHLGDFCFKNSSNKGEGVKVNASFWMSKLNGNMVLLRGNHDKNNSARSPIKKVELEYDNKKILLIHDPSDYKGKRYDLVLCGHVHEAWTTRKRYGVNIINVGVDVNKFMPVTFQELLKHTRR